MMKVIFTYKRIETIIQSNFNDKIEDVYKKYGNKIGIDISKVFFIYNGNKINDNIILNNIINEEDKRRNIMNILVNENDNPIIKDNIVKSKEIICPKCNENILIKIDEYKINFFNCKNNHNIDNILLNEFENMQNVDISKIICNNCKIKNKSNTYNNEIYRCNICKINLCPLCKSSHNNNHKIINYDNKNYICEIHNMSYIKYCKDCKSNICMLCSKEHKNHSIIYYDDMILSEEDNKKEINKLKDYINKFNNNINDIIDKLNKVKYNMNIYYNMYNNIINNYNCENINYEILYNINEFNKYNNIIIKDIYKIINDNNINNKFNNILNIYYQMNNKSKINNKMSNNNENNNKIDYKMNNNNNTMNINNNEYNNKINFKFEKDSNNLKYKYDITNTNDDWGVNDMFEVFISYKDNKEYIISPNKDNFNLDIFTLLDNQKIKSLNRHKNHITTVRYFINNKDYNEYLISADYNYIVIIWDITNNYNIKYQINTTYNYPIFSCLLVFPHNNNDNYIITSTWSTSNDNDKSATIIYSLNNGNFIKYINNTNNNEIYYLLSWYNKKNNKYYIIQLSSYKIIINNLLEDELYSELIHQPEDIHYSGFIYNIDNNDYLCSSSRNGYINIWDLYNKKIFKVINTNNCSLYHIIQWNNNYIIVADYGYKCYKIINLENEIIKDIEKQHTEGVECIKKIYHPKYGESLLSAANDNIIKLWSIN